MKKQKLSFLIILLSLLMISVAACGGGGGGTGVEPNPNPNPNPEPDPDPPAGISFDSGNIMPGDSYSYTFDETGSADYICTIHPSMQGSVTVADNESTNNVTVTIDNMSFSPSTITIGPGTTVTWVNESDINHTATSQ